MKAELGDTPVEKRVAMGTMIGKENDDFSLSVFIVYCGWTHLKNLIKISILSIELPNLRIVH